jgi:hypothetical protein
MCGLVVRDEDNPVVGIVAGVYAVRNPNESQQHDQDGRNVRASLSESLEHRLTTVPIAL